MMMMMMMMMNNGQPKRAIAGSNEWDIKKIQRNLIKTKISICFPFFLAKTKQIEFLFRNEILHTVVWNLVGNDVVQYNRPVHSLLREIKSDLLSIILTGSALEPHFSAPTCDLWAISKHLHYVQFTSKLSYEVRMSCGWDGRLAIKVNVLLTLLQGSVAVGHCLTSCFLLYSQGRKEIILSWNLTLQTRFWTLLCVTY